MSRTIHFLWVVCLTAGCIGEISQTSVSDADTDADALNDSSVGDFGETFDLRTVYDLDTSGSDLGVTQGDMQVDMVDTTPQEPPARPDPNLLDNDQLFICPSDQVIASPALLRRVEPKRLRTRWAGFNFLSPYATNPSLHYSTNSSMDTFDDSNGRRLIDIAMLRAEGYMENRRLNAACFWDDPLPDSACLDKWLNWHMKQFVAHRPLTPKEQQRFIDFGLKIINESEDSEVGKMLLVAATFASALTIYREELGVGEPDEDGRTRLGAYEIGQALSFTFLNRHLASYHNSQALVALQQAVAKDELQTREQVEMHVRALLQLDNRDGNPIMAIGVREFFQQYMGYLDANKVFKNGGPHVRYIPDYFDEHTEYVVEQVVVMDSNVLSNLMTTQQGKVYADRIRDGEYVNEENEPYNIERGVLVGDGVVTFPESERNGVFTHPAWIANQSRNVYNEAHAVYRGKWIRENLLCGHIPELPINVDAVLPTDTDKTVRERLALATDPSDEGTNQYCVGCHQLMNPLGYPFESYDHHGRHRIDERVFTLDADGDPEYVYKPVNSTSTLVATGDPALDGKTVNNALELMDLLASSERVEQCFVRQSFRFYMGRDERLEDSCTLAAMQHAYTSNGGSFQEMIVTLFTSDTFLYRTPSDDIQE